jgi:uncharacterized protein
MKKIIIRILCLFLMTLSTSLNAETIHCDKPEGSQEKMICQDPLLRQMDWEINQLYAQVLKVVNVDILPVLKDEDSYGVHATAQIASAGS